MDDFLQSGFYKSPLGRNNVNWFANENIKLENKMAFYFEHTNKDIVMTEEDEEDFKYNTICRSCEKNVESDIVRDYCHLTGEYRGPAHSKGNINVTQKQSNFSPFTFHDFSNYDSHMFFRELVEGILMKE